MFDVTKLDDVITGICEEVEEQGADAETILALAELITARASISADFTD